MKPFEELLEYFVNVVSMNGNLILNVSPRADGTMPADQEDRLRRLGRWLEINGEAVFGSRAWKQHRHGENIWFTQSKDGRVVYVFHQGPLPDNLAIAPLSSLEKMSITLLGDDQPMSWKPDTEGGLVVQVPERHRSEARTQEDQPIVVLRVEHAGEVSP